MAKPHRYKIDQSTWTKEQRNFIQQALFDMTAEVPEVYPASEEVAFDTPKVIDETDLRSRVTQYETQKVNHESTSTARQAALKAKLNLSDEEIKTLREMM